MRYKYAVMARAHISDSPWSWFVVRQFDRKEKARLFLETLLNKRESDLKIREILPDGIERDILVYKARITHELASEDVGTSGSYGGTTGD